MKSVFSVLLLLLTTTLPTLAAEANPPPVALGDDSLYAESLRALTILFVVAVLLESAFAIIFNWRIFLTYFSLRGVKTPVMIIVSYIVVAAFDLDVLAALINAYRPPPPMASSFASSFITALILAGGSAGVHNIMSALGYRSQRPVEEVQARPERNAAWLAVHVTFKNAISPAEVHVVDCGPLPNGATVPLPNGATVPRPIAGTVDARRPKLMDLMFRNNSRFPPSGGYTLQPNQIYDVRVTGEARDGTRLEAPSGGRRIALAPGAIVDLSVTL